MLQTHPGIFVRLNADGYDITSSLCAEEVSAHAAAYMGRNEVVQELNLIADGLKERRCLIKASELLSPKIGKVETLRRDIQDIPQRFSTFDAVNRLSYAERATFNPDMSCYPGTRMHLLSIIYEWMDQKRFKQPILWLKGLFGAGKSAISHSVAREASDQKVLASAFFMTPGTTSRDVGGPSTQSMNMPSIDNLVSTLIRDLAGISPNFRDAVGAELESSPRLMTASPIEQLDQLFYPLLPQLPRDRKFLWVIDGFDEIIRQDREGLCARDILESLVKHGQTLSGSNFIIFVTSRPFESHPFEKFTGDYILPLVLDLGTPENAMDIDAIAFLELQKIAEQRGSVFDCPLRHSTLATAFRDKAAGLPLWLKIVRNFLMKSIDPNRALLDLVKPEIGPIGYRQRINETYASVIKAQIDLTDPDNQRYLNNVITVLLSLQRPISRPVLSDLFHGAEDHPSSVIHGVLNALHPLLLGLDNDNPVEFIHLSLRDFFHSSPTFGDLIQDVPAPRDFASGHFSLLVRSFHILQARLEDAEIIYEAEDGGIPNDPLGGVETSEALLYSASAWTHHITQVPASRDYKFDALDSFLADQFPNWLEFHICFGSLLFSSEFMEIIHNIHEGHYVRFCSAIKDRSVANALESISSRLFCSHRFQEAASAGSQAVLSWRSKATSVETNSHLAFSLDALGRAQHELRLSAALTASEESVQIYRVLATEQPAVFTGDLALALNSLSILFHDAGKVQEALETSQESVDIYRDLAAKQPAIFNGDLALTLNNLSFRFSTTGRREDALELSQQSVDLYRELVAQRPAAFNGDLALALNSLCVDLNAVGKRAEALEASQQSVKLYRHLAEERPAVFNGALARALNNLSICFDGAGAKEAAVEASQQSVDLYRELAAEGQAAFKGDLARALNNLSFRFSTTGRREEALEASQQSVDLYRELVAQRPAAFNGDLALALNSLCVDLNAAGKRAEAFEASQQSVKLYRHLAEERPAVFNGALARALNNLSICFDGAGAKEAAVEASLQSVEIYRTLAAERPTVFNLDFACALNNLAVDCSAAGRSPEAFEARQQSVEVYRKLAAERPAEFKGELALALNNLSSDFSEAGKMEEAFEASRQSVELYLELAAEQPATFNASLANAMNTFSETSYQLNVFLEAYELSKSSVIVSRATANASSDKSFWRLAEGLTRFAKIAWLLQDHAMAVEALEESIFLYKGLADDGPSNFQNKLTILLKLQSEWRREGSDICLRQKPETGYGTSLVKRTPCV
ncbi:hypothetical protein DL96DRAFT_1011510 [Flagelloscypha sp. PMI_526]|nr:hypothetical protein DL96DRAFT_1011510 [Flagelloscypha sp. PMI_526]